MNPETNDRTDGGLAAGEPDPDFVRNLEWQVRTAARRESRFARPLSRGPLRSVRLAAIVALALAGGASATLAVQHFGQSRSAELQLHRARIELALVQQRVAAQAKRTEQVQQQAQAGLVPVSEQERTAADLAKAKSDEQIRRIELEETLATGRAPDDSLSAPLIDGRDFVTERLELRRNDAQAASKRVAAGLIRIEKLRKAAFAPEIEVAAVRAELLRMQSNDQSLAARVELRRRFLAGDLTAARVELEGRRVLAASRVEELAAQLADAESSLKRMQELQRNGLVAQGELEAAALALAESKAALELAHDELALLDEELTTVK